jgi:hypothetical protein
MELPSRNVKQNGEIVQAASGFNQCDVTLILNGPVIVRLYEQRLFVCRKTRAMLRSFLDPFNFLFGTQDFRCHSGLSPEVLRKSQREVTRKVWEFLATVL